MASVVLPQEIIPALTQATAALMNKLSQSAAIISPPTVAPTDARSSNEPTQTVTEESVTENSPFQECLSLLTKYPHLVSPAPLFSDSYTRWRQLPRVTYDTFEENRRLLTDPYDTRLKGFASGDRLNSELAFVPCDDKLVSPSVLVRRALGSCATQLFLNSTSSNSLTGVSPCVSQLLFNHQQRRGFKTRARTTGLGRARSQETSTHSTLDELKAKFDLRGSQFTGIGSTSAIPMLDKDKQSFSQVLRQHDQSPEIQGHLKVAFADGYATADSNSHANKPTGIKKFVIRTWRIFWAVLAMVLILQFLVSGWDGISGIAGGGSGTLNINQHEVNAEEVDVSFSDVKGVDEAKEELVEIVEFLKDPTRFSALGGRMPRGVLLVGKPGIGKTLLARAVAGEAGVPFFHASGSEFDEIFVGTGAKRVRQLFAAAKQRAPCVLFIDEIDTCGAKRTSSQLHPYANQTINQLLAEMDGFNKSEGVVVLGATNKRENLDPALLRPGRFDVEVQVWPPDLKGRTELFDHYLSKVTADNISVSSENLAKKTIGFLGAQIANVVNQAAIKAARENALLITMKDLEWALDKERMGPEKKNRIDDEPSIKRTAFHEAGHTIVNYYTKHADPINKVTIVPRGESLGRLDMMQDREYDTTKGKLVARIDVMMGGRVGEEMMLGEENVATGAVSDFQQATNIATQIVKSWGMSDKAGVRTYGESRHLSESMKELVDNEIRKLLDESYKRAKSVMEEHKEEHRRLVQALLKYETLDADDIKAVIEGKGPPSAEKKKEEKITELNADSKDIISKGLLVSGAGAASYLPIPPGDKPRTPSGQ